MSILDNKTILITGGAGSFGQKFTEIVLKEHNPKAIRIYDHDELAEVEMQRRTQDPRLRFFIGEVRDRNRLHRAMHGVNLVVHAAALKHIPICEYNPLEAVKTNIGGASNVIDAAIENSVPLVMNISTDKAVQPVNLYGAAKMVAEKLFVQSNSYAGGRTKFSCSRYGNVLASSGSIIPLFLEQSKNGEITITDEQMTRFWITLDQGVHFVIGCIERMMGGEIFIPKIPSMKVVDLADVIAPGARRKIIGIRPGEKLHEVLMVSEEARHSKEFDTYFVIEPEFPFWNKENGKEGKELLQNFSYASNTNKEWITKEQMQEILNVLAKGK
ncbi:MAG: UDP-N-acetylglucosamine 4,6-dehydratase (inverting) [Candidatus Wildermuthbacteria bacterium]|nr:UDP-N-acetylglucosamine 4,6-dehydratase (inverting) [Candidatus Wildermuthbacteria bacterium]